MSATGALAQAVLFSPLQQDEDVKMDFKILGKADGNYLVYKNIRWKHILTLYDSQMRVVKSERIKFVPDRTFNMDFIVYPGYFFIFYQFEKNGVLFCYAVKMNNLAEQISDPILLDITRMSIVSSNKIYSSVFSEDKQRILIYKTQLKNEKLTLVSKLFNKDLQILDSNRMVVPFNDRLGFYGDLVLANDGTVFFAKNNRRSRGENFSELQLFSRFPGDSSYLVTDIPLSGKYIDEVFIRPDNLNRTCLINSFYYDKPRGNITGLFSALWSAQFPLRAQLNLFEDSIRSRINATGQDGDVFDNLFIRNTMIRRNGSFILTAESYFLRRASNDNSWNRSSYLNNYPYYSTSDYFSPDPYYYNYYRPYQSSAGFQSTRYYYDDIFVLSIDSSLKCKWQNILAKRQYDDDNENFLSFCTMNMSGELIFFYIEDNRKNGIVSNRSLLPDGQIRSYGVIKSREPDFEFMPRLAKQVGAREMIVPCAYRSSIIFARLDFSK